ncbi:hypothetical protein [Ligilactobacillus murinus]|uniref:hypothetical protein n=1 Tax=Ligilactobacillus murinus TaxID=1622 RepID=UPI0021AB8C1A|nr:hypothetical protein [Ligilactobacillus murinus]
MANLTFNVAGVSLSINTADADLINELRRFNNNLEIVQELFTKQQPNGGNIKDTAQSFGVSPAVVTGWIKNGMPFVDIDGMKVSDHFQRQTVVRRKSNIKIRT